MVDIGDCIGKMDSDWIEEQLTGFQLTFDANSSEVVSKMNILSETYNLTANELMDDLIAYAANGKGNGTNLDEQLLSRYEDTVLVKKADQSMNETLQSASHSSRVVLGEKKVVHERDDSPDLDASSFIREIEAESSLGEKYQKFTPDRNAASNVAYQNRKNKGKMLASHFGKFYARDARRKNDIKVRVELGLEETIRSSLFHYGNEKDADKIEEICSHVDKLTEAIREGNKITSGFEPVDTISSEPFTICGQIFDESGDQLHAITCSLQATDENALAVNLDLSKLSSYSLFPGKVVAMRGVNENGSLFSPLELFEAPLLPTAAFSPQKGIENLRIWCAAGPFTSPDTLSFEQLYDFLELANKESPDVIILMGPFIDRTSKAAQSPTLKRTYTELFENLVVNIYEKLKENRARLIFVPSKKDATSLPFYPVAPFEVSRDCKKNLPEDIIFASDPAIVKIAGIEFALSNSEILQHLGRDEIHCSENSENEDRMARLISHLIRQRSLYPLYPPPSGFSQCIPRVIKASSLSQTPHVMILSSMLAPMVKLVDGCLCANMTYLARGSYLRFDINVNKFDENQSSLADFCSMKIVRL